MNDRYVGAILIVGTQRIPGAMSEKLLDKDKFALWSILHTLNSSNNGSQEQDICQHVVQSVIIKIQQPTAQNKTEKTNNPDKTNFQHINPNGNYSLFTQPIISQTISIRYSQMWNFGFNNNQGHRHHHHHHHNHNVGFGFNRWGFNNTNYMNHGGFVAVNYSSGWVPNVHDQLLINNINQVFLRYDFNRSGQLEGNEFYYAYRDLCLLMGMAPPSTYQEVWQAAMQCDTNCDGRISRGQLFMMFKRIQGINVGMMQLPYNYC